MNMLSKLSTATAYLLWPETVTGGVTLFTKTGSTDNGDTFDAGVNQPVVRMLEPDEDQLEYAINVLGESTAQVFEIWDRGQAKFPKVGCRIQHPNGTNYSIRRVQNLVFTNLYACTCIEEK